MQIPTQVDSKVTLVVTTTLTGLSYAAESLLGGVIHSKWVDVDTLASNSQIQLTLSPMNTIVSLGEKLLPEIVILVPPASDPTCGEMLLTLIA